jgi:uncharacterized protein
MRVPEIILPPPTKFPGSRDRHLFGPGPKRILSLDGGGVRGAITVSFLERLEKVIEEIEGKPTLLCDWFDLIGGTSAGSIIATALALGLRASDIREIQTALAPTVFRKRFWRFGGLRAMFGRRDLIRELEKFVAGRTLGSEDLRTGLCIISKRLDSGSAWMLCNNPKSIFWDSPPDRAFTGNRHYPLANIVRASAAAPHYFDPEIIEIVKGEPPGIFIDGALTPHNNPAFQLLLLATLPQYGLSWTASPQDLVIVSVGTGSYRQRVERSDLRWTGNLGMTLQALTAQMTETQNLIATLMTWLGDCPFEWPINSELANLGKTNPPFGPLFRYLRYDVLLEHKWLEETLGLTVDREHLKSLRRIDVPENIADFYQLGAKAAALQIRREDLLHGAVAIA